MDNQTDDSSKSSGSLKHYESLFTGLRVFVPPQDMPPKDRSVATICGMTLSAVIVVACSTKSVELTLLVALLGLLFALLVQRNHLNGTHKPPREGPPQSGDSS